MRNSITDIDQLSIGGLYEMAVNNSLRFQKPYDMLYMWHEVCLKRLIQAHGQTKSFFISVKLLPVATEDNI